MPPHKGVAFRFALVHLSIRRWKSEKFLLVFKILQQCHTWNLEQLLIFVECIWKGQVTLYWFLHSYGPCLTRKYDFESHIKLQICLWFQVLESFKIMDYSLLVGIHNLDTAKKEKV